MGPFAFVRVDVQVDWRCTACGFTGTARLPIVVDWCDRPSAVEQRGAADGLTCPECNALEPLELPLLQYRRADGIGLLVGLPPHTLGAAHEWARDAVLAATAPTHGEETPPDLDGGDVVVSVPMRWWGLLWNRPLAPRLLGLLPLHLEESAEEVDRWRKEALTLLGLPDIRATVAAFVEAASRADALAVAEQHPEILLARWRMTVDTQLGKLVEQQASPEQVEALDARAAVLRQARVFGVDGLRRIIADNALRPRIDAAASASDPEVRLAALQAAIDAPGPPDSPLRVVAHNAYVQALHGRAGRRPADDDELLQAAARAVEVAEEVLGPRHELTLAAIINHAVCVDECAPGDRASANAAAVTMLCEVGPRAAISGTDVLADVAINLATLAASAPESSGDDPERARELLADAKHIGELLSYDNRRATLTTLVDEAAVLRSKQSGSLRANAASAVQLLDRALELEAAWQILSAPERTLVAMNRANALAQLHAYAPADAPAEEVRIAARKAVAAANELDEHCQRLRSPPVST